MINDNKPTTDQLNEKVDLFISKHRILEKENISLKVEIANLENEIQELRSAINNLNSNTNEQTGTIGNIFNKLTSFLDEREISDEHIPTQKENKIKKEEIMTEEILKEEIKATDVNDLSINPQNKNKTKDVLHGLDGLV